jgi:hypothetical protein
MMKELFDAKTTALDLVGLLTFIGVIAQVIPVIAGVLTIAWGWYYFRSS